MTLDIKQTDELSSLPLVSITYQEDKGILLFFETAGHHIGKQSFIATLRLGYVTKNLANDKQQ